MHTSPQPPREEAARQANLLGALAVAVAGRFDTSSEAAALVALHVYLGGRPIEALRRVLALSHPATVRLVDRLQERGMLRRAPGQDRRTVTLELTAAGHAAAAGLLAAREAAIRELLDHVADDERAAFARTAERLLDALVGDRAQARRICRLCDAEACGHLDGRCPATNAARRKAPQDYEH